MIFSALKEYGGVNFTRIDLALDDYAETVKFSDIEKKLNKGHYRSSRKSYNIVKTSDTNGKPLETIYMGTLGLKMGAVGTSMLVSTTKGSIRKQERTVSNRSEELLGKDW